MAIRCTCPRCGKVTDVDDQYAGQDGVCTVCGEAITIPGAADAGAGSLPPPTHRGGVPLWGMVAGVLFLLLVIWMLLPSVGSVREAPRRVSSSNNLKAIGLALHNYHFRFGCFPARANFDKQGKPLLSWRVLILPYLEQADLYGQFHLDEPWDSEHNRKLIPMMPAVYHNPSIPPDPGMASYLAVCGKGLAFDGEKGRKIEDFKDGTSQTILVVEADPDRAVTWTKPDDWQYDAKQPLAGLGHAHQGGFFALFADASARFIPRAVDPKVFHALLTIAGGEMVKPADLGP
jgi:hypothetical protein